MKNLQEEYIVFESSFKIPEPWDVKRIKTLQLSGKTEKMLGFPLIMSWELMVVVIYFSTQSSKKTILFVHVIIKLKGVLN